MKAITIEKQSLNWNDVDDLPSPEPDEVAIDVVWAGMNRADLMQRKGAYPPPRGFKDPRPRGKWPRGSRRRECVTPGTG